MLICTGVHGACFKFTVLVKGLFIMSFKINWVEQEYGLGKQYEVALASTDGNDLLNGSAGPDTLEGGFGNDTYIVNNSRDLVIEAEGAGVDTVFSYVSYSLETNVENLVVKGLGDLRCFGNILDNRIIGNAGDNLLNGGEGDDTLTGGAGDDTYVVDTKGDTVVDTGGDDRIRSEISLTLIDAIEDLVLLGNANLIGEGNASDNR